jgi:acetolactate synthase-1/2/3 large subunit
MSILSKDPSSAAVFRLSFHEIGQKSQKKEANSASEPEESTACDCSTFPHTSSPSLQPGPMPGVRNGAEALLDTLVECGVDTIFGYPGGRRAAAVRRAARRAAAAPCAGAPRAGGSACGRGLCAQHGPRGRGAGHFGAGRGQHHHRLLDAMSDSVPVLCISGQVATAVIGTQAFQESDALGMSRSVTKWNQQVRAADDVPRWCGARWRSPLPAAPGPVLLDVPKDIQLRGWATAPHPSRCGRCARAGRRCRRGPCCSARPICFRRRAGRCSTAAAG